jgi:hypothetical protein
MPTRITCPHCHHDIRLPDDLYDGPAECPYCHGAFGVRWPPRARRPPPPAVPDRAERRPCPFCGGLIMAGATKCRFCGEWLEPAPPPRRAAAPAEPPQPQPSAELAGPQAAAVPARPQPPAQATFYKIDSRRLTLGECWGLSPNPFAFLLVAVLKLLRVRLFGSWALPRAESLTLLRPEQVPDAVHEQWRGAIEVCRSHGLDVQFYYTLPTLGSTWKCYEAALLGPDGRTLAVLALVRTRRRGSTAEELALACVSRLPGGRLLITTDARRRLHTPPENVIEHMPGYSAFEVLERHRERFAEHERDMAAFEPAKLEAFLVAMSNRALDFHARRGVYVPMTEEEMSRHEAGG